MKKIPKKSPEIKQKVEPQTDDPDAIEVTEETLKEVAPKEVAPKEENQKKKHQKKK